MRPASGMSSSSRLAVLALLLAVLSITLLAVQPHVAEAAGPPFGVSGYVHDWPADTPIAGIVVRVVSADETDLENAASTYTTVTAGDGSFSITGLPSEGYYHVSFIDRSDTYRDQHYWGQGVPIDQAWAVNVDEVEDLGTTYMLTASEVLSHRVTRASGRDRYQTAIAVADKWGSADTVILASGLGFADALAAAPLAGCYDAPILLTPPDALPSGLTSCLARLGVTDVIIVGGTAVVSPDVYQTLQGLGYRMQRIAGSNRYDTGYRVVLEVSRICGAQMPEEPLIVRGDDFADALAIAPFAFIETRPIILVEPDHLPLESMFAMSYLHNVHSTDTIFIIGGEGAVTPEVIDEIYWYEYMPGDLYYWRVAGANRYDTAARCVWEYWGWDVDIYGLACGGSFPDALACGPWAGGLLGGVLLTPPDSLAPEARAQLRSDRNYIWDVVVAGGTTAVSDSVSAAVTSALGTSFYDMDSYSGVASAMRQYDPGADVVDFTFPAAQTTYPRLEALMRTGDWSPSVTVDPSQLERMGTGE